MFSHSLNGLVYSDASTSSTSSSPSSFTQSPRHLGPSAYTGSSQQAPAPGQLHRAPDVPSTFLPSYYPEGRYASLEHELMGSPAGYGHGHGQGLPQGFGPISTMDHSRGHSPATWEKLSQAGPSTRNLLDGINIADPHPRTSRDPGPPSYRITPGDIASSLVQPGHNRASSSYSPFPLDPNLHSSSSTPQGYGTDSPVGGGGGGGSLGGGGGSGSGGGGGAGRYHPYTRDREPYGTSDPMSASSSSLSRNNTNPNANVNTYTNTTLPEPSPSSNAYPGNMYGSVPLPDRPEDRWDRSQFDGEITGEDYAQALEIYSHMLEAVPSMRLQHDALPPGGQRYDHLIDLASDGFSILTGRNAGGANQGQIDLTNPTGGNNGSGVPGSSSSQKRPGGSGAGSGSGTGSEKKMTKCLGCGATETPEWRRGPMGPRTLCNACGLVHMKLQRKKKKQEEKAAAAAAAAAAAEKR